ncbi:MULTISPECIES: ABC transporter ATP-binding protein [Clostridia]|uniref:ABC transporter ATP-binding protein n=1 Tax=Clostridia TaxID=186801 RepID=UPI00067EE3BD|nr:MULTISPECIES: ABC transporter ATP-binding protein [Clostridia]
MNILELNGIEKIYSNGVAANKEINIAFEKSEIHAIVGENGAGKTTLMKIIFGLEEPTKGSILLAGKEVSLKSPLDAVHMGIGMVHQHFMLIPSFTVLENILLGREPNKLGVLQLQKERKNVEKLCREYQFDINLDDKVENLNVGNKQKVEILKVLYQKADIIILDEPTAVLTPQETEKLFQQLILLKEMGKTIIFISHKLNEVKQISDRITVLRKGKVISTHNTEDVDAEQISELMIGRRVTYSYEDIRKKTAGSKVLSVEHLTYKDQYGKTALNDISFVVSSGEIVGIVGVEGNGQTELVEVLFGMKKNSAGHICLDQTDISGMNIKNRRKQGMSYIPEDRMILGTAADGNIKENMISSFYTAPEISGRVFMKDGNIEKITNELVKKFEILCNGVNNKINSLSGGNIQKVVFARESYMGSKLMIAEQPTRGVDVGSASLIHQYLIHLRNEGKAILMFSADLSEAQAVCDRIFVLYSGEIAAELDEPERITEQEIGLYMLGLKKQERGHGDE